MGLSQMFWELDLRSWLRYNSGKTSQYWNKQASAVQSGPTRRLQSSSYWRVVINLLSSLKNFDSGIHAAVKHNRFWPVAAMHKKIDRALPLRLKQPLLAVVESYRVAKGNLKQLKIIMSGLLAGLDNIFLSLWGLVWRSGHLFSLLNLLLLTTCLGWCSYYNMLGWAAFHGALAHDSIDDLRAVMAALSCQLGVYTLFEEAMKWWVDELARVLQFCVSQRWCQQLFDVQSSRLASLPNAAKTATSDLRITIFQCVSVSYRTWFGLIVIVGNAYYMWTHKLRALLLYTVLGHFSLNAISYVLANTDWRWSLKQLVQQTNNEEYAIADGWNRYIAQSLSFIGMDSVRERQAAFLQNKDKRRFYLQGKKLLLTHLHELFVKFYDRGMPVISLAVVLCNSVLKLPLPRADAVLSYSVLTQALQATKQMFVHMGYLSKNADNVAFMTQGFDAIERMCDTLFGSTNDFTTGGSKRSRPRSLLRNLTVDPNYTKASTPRLLFASRQLWLLLNAAVLVALVLGAWAQVVPAQMYLVATLSTAHWGKLMLGWLFSQAVFAVVLLQSSRSHPHWWQLCRQDLAVSVSAILMSLLSCVTLYNFGLVQTLTLTLVNAGWACNHAAVLCTLFACANIGFGIGTWRVCKTMRAYLKNNMELNVGADTNPSSTALRVEQMTMQGQYGPGVKLAGTFEIRPSATQRTFMVFGQNGAGKSTLIDAIRAHLLRQPQSQHAPESGSFQVEVPTAATGTKKFEFINSSKMALKNLMIISQGFAWDELPRPALLAAVNLASPDIDVISQKNSLRNLLGYYLLRANTASLSPTDQACQACIRQDLLAQDSKLCQAMVDFLKVVHYAPGLLEKVQQGAFASGSGGENAKLHFAIFAVMSLLPQITKQPFHLVIDEPSAAVDVDSQILVLQQLLQAYQGKIYHQGQAVAALTMVLHNDNASLLEHFDQVRHVRADKSDVNQPVAMKVDGHSIDELRKKTDYQSGYTSTWRVLG